MHLSLLTIYYYYLCTQTPLFKAIFKPKFATVGSISKIKFFLKHKEFVWFIISLLRIKIFFNLYFLLSIHNRESVVFGSNFPNEDFDGFTRFEGLWIRKLHF